MSEQIREQVSAFLDGELPDSETELLLKRLTRDGELRESFGRYSLIGEALRGASSDRVTKGFAAGVNLAIDGEPVHVAVHARELRTTELVAAPGRSRHCRRRRDGGHRCPATTRILTGRQLPDRGESTPGHRRSRSPRRSNGRASSRGAVPRGALLYRAGDIDGCAGSRRRRPA